jgi:hypothetical protein
MYLGGRQDSPLCVLEPNLAAAYGDQGTRVCLDPYPPTAEVSHYLDLCEPSLDPPEGDIPIRCSGLPDMFPLVYAVWLVERLLTPDVEEDADDWMRGYTEGSGCVTCVKPIRERGCVVVWVKPERVAEVLSLSRGTVLDVSAAWTDFNPGTRPRLATAIAAYMQGEAPDPRIRGEVVTFQQFIGRKLEGRRMIAFGRAAGSDQTESQQPSG